MCLLVQTQLSEVCEELTTHVSIERMFDGSLVEGGFRADVVLWGHEMSHLLRNIVS